MYSKRDINLVTLFFTTIIFVLVSILYAKIESSLQKIENNQKNVEIRKMEEDIEQEDIKTEENEEKDVGIDIAQINEWEIIIPKLDLIATIKEGVSSDVIAKNVGHFEETSLLKGNVGLAAHNRGYAMNFFQEIKKLVANDIIVYRVNENEKKYAVKTVTIIDDTDFSYLQKTNDNRITLITCVENNPTHRICVQAVEII